MEFPGPEKFKIRFWETFLTAPKVFIGAALWEGFALGCKCSSYSMSYYWLSGLGSAVGTVVGHLLITFIIQIFGHKFLFFNEFTQGFLFALPVIFGSGTAWQRVVNDGHDWGMDFTHAFFYMWLISFLLFFVSLTFFRTLINYCADKINGDSTFDHLKDSMYMDYLLALSVGLGDAFFMGTAAVNEFPDNWLESEFGVQDSTPVFIAMVKSGFSSTCGFLVMQTVQNCCLKYCWTDGVVLEDVADSLMEVTNRITLTEISRLTFSTMDRFTFSDVNRFTFSGSGFRPSAAYNSNSGSNTTNNNSRSNNSNNRSNSTNVHSPADIKNPIQHTINSANKTSSSSSIETIRSDVNNNSVRADQTKDISVERLESGVSEVELVGDL